MTTLSNDKLWMLLPWALLGTGLVGWGYMASLAVRDPGFSLERDYYRKATAWDEEQQKRAQSARLGWHLTPRQAGNGVELSLTGKADEALSGASGQLEAFAVARASAIQTVALRETAPGKYEAPVQLSRPGLWELRVTLKRGADTFTETVRLDAVQEGVP